MDSSAERQVKSSARVRDLGEVFTSASTVGDVLDLLPPEVWTVHPSPTFLEPACGDGNFLTAILSRKLSAVEHAHREGRLPAGSAPTVVQAAGLEALASVYGVDISYENIVGGVPGHEIGARARLMQDWIAWHSRVLGKRPAAHSRVLRAVEWIVEHNVLIGDMLPETVAGRPTGRERLPIVEYAFDPSGGTVVLSASTLGDAYARARSETDDALSLFDPPEAAPFWRGAIFDLGRAPARVVPHTPRSARNGVGGRS